MPLDPAVIAELLAAAAGEADYEPPAVVYLAALTDEPNDTVQGTECAGDGYARCVFAPSTGMVLVDGVWLNASDIVFGISGEDLGTVVAIAAYADASATTGRQWYSILSAGVDWASGLALRIPAGQLTVQYPS